MRLRTSSRKEHSADNRCVPSKGDQVAFVDITGGGGKSWTSVNQLAVPIDHVVLGFYVGKEDVYIVDTNKVLRGRLGGAVPGGMLQRAGDMAQTARIIYQDHEGDGGAAEDVNAIETLLHLTRLFWVVKISENWQVPGT